EPSDLYDWFKGWEDLKPALVDQLHSNPPELSEDMYNDGYKNIVNNDFSEIVIENMKQKYKETAPDMDWLVMDVMDMKELPDASFDVAIDKGTMDAIMCEKGDSWELDPKIAERCHLMCAEVARILKPGGKYIQITFGQPHFRKRVLVKPEYNWELQTRTVGEFFHYFIYIMTKATTSEPATTESS
ncbi:endothelin converting enzyme 2, putative, partial [Acanthamoeba castellanii str. Neff]